jgi:hypothetical protein
MRSEHQRLITDLLSNSVKHAPVQNYDNFAVSDPFYAWDLGNNWILRSTISK